jgi:hypothetical protein
MKRILGWLFVGCWFSSLVNVATSQFQVLLLGTVKIPVLVAKVALVAIPFFWWLVSSELRIRKHLFVPWLLFAACISASTTMVALQGTLPVADQVTGLLTIYLYLIAIPLFQLVKPIIKLKQVSIVLCVAFVPLSALGIAQHLLGRPIVATSSPDNSLYITSWDFYGSVRAFSLFASGLDFSFFLAIAMAFFTAHMLRRESRFFTRVIGFGGVTIGAIATYCTMTRIAYLTVPLTVCFSAYLTKGRKLNWRAWALAPILALALGILLVIVLPLLTQQVVSDSLKGDSLVERLGFWSIALSTWLSTTSSAFWFGTGVAQGTSNVGYIVDNTFLNFAVQSGVLGLCGSVFLMFAIWMSMRKLINANTDPEVIALVSFWLTFLLSGMFNVSNYAYALAFLPLLAAENLNWKPVHSESSSVTRPLTGTDLTDRFPLEPLS